MSFDDGQVRALLGNQLEGLFAALGAAGSIARPLEIASQNMQRAFVAVSDQYAKPLSCPSHDSAQSCTNYAFAFDAPQSLR